MSGTEEQPTLIRPAITAAPFLVTGRLLDRIPEIGDPIGLAFSIRRVYTGYFGPAMRVRRASDGAERDIGFVQTVLDIEDLERHCAGFDGYVSVWYDQSGQGRHARQSNWSIQPRIVRGGSVVRDILNNVAMEFNGSYLVTDWEPKETEVGEASGMMMVASSGIGVQGQTGQIQQIKKDATEVDEFHVPDYPNADLPEGADRFLLEATVIPDDSENDPKRIMVYRGKDKKLHVFDADAETVTNLIVETASGPTFITASDIADPNLGTAERRGEAPDGTRAWYAAVEGSDGKVYGIPARANRIVVIDPRDPSELGAGEPKVEYLALPGMDQGLTADKWYTGILSAKTGCIVCPPYNQVTQGSAVFLIIDTKPGSPTYQNVKLFGTFGGVQEMCREIVEYNDDLFLVPFRDVFVRRLTLSDVENYSSITEPENRIVSRQIADQNGNLLGSNLGGLFSSGVVAENGNLYCVPWNIGTFLVVSLSSFEDTETNPFSVIGDLGLRALIRDWGWEGTPNFVSNPRLSYTGDGYVLETDQTEREFSVNMDAPGFGNQGIQTLTAKIRANRIVTGATVTNAGDGYIQTPSLRVRQGPTSSINVASFQIVMKPADSGVGLQVDRIDVTSRGRGYRGGGPALQLTGGKGRQAVLRALFDRASPGGSLLGIQVDDGGTGYFKPYIDDARIEIAAPRTGQTATAEIDPDIGWVLVDEENESLGYKLNQVNLINPGTNYTNAPIVRLVTVAGGRPLQGYEATAVVGDSNTKYDLHVNQVTIVNGGSGYAVTDPNNLANTCHVRAIEVPPGGVRFVARITGVDANGGIAGYEIVDAGRGYDEAPTLEIANAPVGSTGANLQPIMKRHGMVLNITQPTITSGYLTPPSISIPTDEQKPGSNDRNVQFLTQFLPPTVGDIRTNEKWIRTFYSTADTGYITGVPTSESRVFRISGVKDSAVTPTFTLAFVAGIRNFRSKYVTGSFDREGKNFFCVPFEERRILRVTMDTLDAQGAGVGFVGPQVRGRYSCSIRSSRNAIYCFPAETQDVLIIDPKFPSASEELQFGNLRSNGRKFSGCAMITQTSVSGWPAGLIYALPDQIPFLLELNPGISLPRTPDLPPPRVLITLQEPDGETPGKRALLFAPSPESPTPYAQLLLLDPQDLGNRISIRIPIEPYDNDTKIPWFLEGTLCPNALKGKVIFVPFYNVNSEHEYAAQNRMLMFDVGKLANVLDQSFTDPGTEYTWSPTGVDVVYTWLDQVPFELRPPYPSRTLVSFQVDTVAETIGWVPSGGGSDAILNQEPFVTYHFGSSDPGFRTKRGLLGIANPDDTDPQKRIPERVQWATAALVDPENTDDRLVSMTYPVPRFSELMTPEISDGDPRWRNARAVVVDDVIYAAPRRKNYMLRIDPGAEEVDRIQSVVFSDVLDPLFDSDKFTDTIYVPLRRELYFIPYDAPWFMVYELDGTGDVRHYTFGESDLTSSRLPGIGEELVQDPLDAEEGREQPNRALFSCAVLTPDSKILCIPENGTRAVLVNPLQDNYLERVERIIEFPNPMEDPDVTLQWEWGRSMYEYAIVYQGDVYCIPSRAKRILKIDLQTNTASFVGPLFESTEPKWGQPALYPDGKIYCAPDVTETILAFSVMEGTLSTELIEIDVGRAQGNTEGAVVGDDNCIYFTPRRNDVRNSIGFDPVTRETFLIGQYVWQGIMESQNMWQNVVKLTNGRLFGMPISYRNVLEIFPSANEFRTYRLGAIPNVSDTRRWYTEPLYTQRDFRAPPIRSFRIFIGKETPTRLLVFHTDTGYAIYDPGSADQDAPRAPTLVFSPSTPDGVSGYFSDGREQTLTSLVYRATEDGEDEYSITRVTLQRGAISGLRSSDQTETGVSESHFYSAVEGDNFTFYAGNGSLTIRGLYGIIYPDGRTGVYSGFMRGGFAEQGPSSGQITAFVRGLSVGQSTYTWNSNASGGATFQIGRVDEIDPITGETVFTAQFSGKLQELVVFQSDQTSRVRTLAENQTFAYGV